MSEGREHLWHKVRAAWTHVYRYHYNDADFFVKADDDTYLVSENLQLLLQSYSPDDALHFGCRFRYDSFSKQVI